MENASYETAEKYDDSAPIDEEAVIASSSEMAKKKKKRPGLSEGLVPGKKAMKFHNNVYGANT